MKRAIAVGLLVLMSALAPLPVSSGLRAAPASHQSPTPTPTRSVPTPTPTPTSSVPTPTPAPTSTPTQQCRPDFTLSASPTSATLPQANNVHFQLTATSVCGASGYIYFQSPSISPQTTSITWNYLCGCDPPLISLSPTTPAQVTLAIIAAVDTPKTTYTITIPAAYQATACFTCPSITSHSVVVTVTVTDPVTPYH
jgi:hypothetical protein